MTDRVHDRVGQLWERDGKRWLIVGLELEGASALSVEHGEAYRVQWSEPNRHGHHECWCRTWEQWAAGAVMIVDLPL